VTDIIDSAEGAFFRELRAVVPSVYAVAQAANELLPKYRGPGNPSVGGEQIAAFLRRQSNIAVFAGIREARRRGDPDLNVEALLASAEDPETVRDWLAIESLTEVDRNDDE